MDLSIGNINLGMKKNWKKFLLITIIFFILFELFLIQGFDFFWEDYYLLRLSNQTSMGYTRLCEVDNIRTESTREIFGNFLNIDSTSVMSRHGVNLSAVYALFGTLFTDNLIWYWTFSFVCLSYLIFLIFLVFKKLNHILFGLFAITLYASFPQVWQVIVSPTWLIATLFMHTLTVSALFLFYFGYQKDMSRFKTFLVFLLIVFLSRFSTLIKQEGRIVFAIIFLYLVIMDRQQIKKFKNLILLLTLFLTSFPFSTGLKSFMLSSGNTAQFVSLTNILSGMNKLVFVYGAINLLSITFILGYLVFFINQRKKTKFKNIFENDLKLIVFLFIWFFCALMMPILAKGLSVYLGPRSWLIIDFFYTLFPMALFLFCGFSLILNTVSAKNKNKTFLLITTIFIISLTIQLVVLNIFVVKHYFYFVGADTVTDFLDSQKIKNSKIFFPFDSFTAPAQVNTPTNYVSVMPFTELQNVSNLISAKGSLSHVYIISNKQMKFSEPERINTIKTFKPRTNSLYSKLIFKLIKISHRDDYIPTFYLYELINKPLNKNAHKMHIKYANQGKFDAS